ncbi:MAG: InlB B-repeat-containing protein [Lachnospiraceae bacterium]|nr:InlB B-repeat-containing protein [Lachnospiraceae bacterium]
MKIIKNTILKRITTFALLLAMVAGMATSLGRIARADQIPNGCYRVTLKCYNKTSTKTVDIGAGPYAYYTLPTQTSDQYGSFAGWKDEATGTIYKGGTQIFVNGHKNFLAIWNTTVIYYTYDGRVITSKSITTGNKYSLPTAPSRDGYDFIGWYYGNQQITPNTVCMTGIRHDITARYKLNSIGASKKIDPLLYGVHNPNLSGLSLPNNSVGGGYFYQCKNMTSSDRTLWGGMCTPCAIGNLLNRKLVLDTHTNQYVFRFNQDVLSVLYYSNSNSGTNVGKYVYKNALGKDNDGNWIEIGKRLGFEFSKSGQNYVEDGRTYKNNNGTGANKKSYTLVKSTKIKSVDKGIERQKYLAQQLDLHPEGIILYSNTHAIVLTNYTYNSTNKTYSFNAIDTAGSNGGKYDYNSFKSINSAWVVTDRAGSAAALFNSAAYILYIK